MRCNQDSNCQGLYEHDYGTGKWFYAADPDPKNCTTGGDKK